MIKSNHKEGRKNHGGQKRGINYIPKCYKNNIPANNKAQAETYAKPLPEKEYGKLTKAVMLSLYTNSEVPFDSIKDLKEVYCEESIIPEGKSKFLLPMSKAIMPPRRTNNYEAKESHGHYYKTEEDQGIFKGTSTSHSNINHAPLWYDSEVISGKEEDNSKPEDTFSMESLASRQLSLEEEKAIFNKQSTSLDKIGTKVNRESLFNNINDNGYSDIDAKYESSLKENTRIAQELFTNPSAELEDSVNAIDVGNIEAEMLKGDKQKEIEKEDDEEVPIWDTYSAEEIKQQSQQDFGSWGQNLSTAIKPFQEQLTIENTNPFCHSSFNIKETDKAWYYCDTQNLIQGPFNSIEMYTWYRGGYFPLNLPVRCGKYSPFVPLADLLNSIKMRQQVEMQSASVQYFKSGNMRHFFDPAMSVEGSKASAPLSLEELESGFIAPAHSSPYQQSISYRNYDPRPYYGGDPAIASLRLEDATESYTRDEAYDLKALLGMQVNSGTPYR